MTRTMVMIFARTVDLNQDQSIDQYLKHVKNVLLVWSKKEKESVVKWYRLMAEVRWRFQVG